MVPGPYHPHQGFLNPSRPRNYKELYNLWHSKACNVVERIHGVLKKHFAMAREPSMYLIATQSHIVPALCTLHNFIQIYDLDDMPKDDNDTGYNNGRDDGDGAASSLGGGIPQAEMTCAKRLRNNFAMVM